MLINNILIYIVEIEEGFYKLILTLYIHILLIQFYIYYFIKNVHN